MSGPAVCEGGLMIDLSGMRDVVVIASGAYEPIRYSSHRCAPHTDR
jgi:hypothetical protein